MLTKFRWTVYINGDLFDIMTDSEVRELIETYTIIRIDSENGVIEL